MCARPRLCKRSLDIANIFWLLRTNKRNTPLARSLRKLAREKLKTQYPDLTDQDRHEIMVVWSRTDCILYKSDALNKINVYNSQGFKNPKELFRRKFDLNGKDLGIREVDTSQMTLDLDFTTSKLKVLIELE